MIGFKNLICNNFVHTSRAESELIDLFLLAKSASCTRKSSANNKCYYFAKHYLS